MDTAFALALLWGLLFVPIGLLVHWVVLGEGARERAIPIAPITGIAVALVVSAALGRLGVDSGSTPIGVAWFAISIASIIVIWRARVPWWSRECIGALAMFFVALLLILIPVTGPDGSTGPLGYGTVSAPVDEVAAIDAASNADTQLKVAREAARTADERPIGFEQFAAITVGIGSDESTKMGASWTAYALHAPITALFAALVAFPLFAFARARGVGSFGLTMLVLLGVLAPYAFLALAGAAGAAIATIAVSISCVFSLIVTRRDRGWWALAVLFGAAVAVTGGVLALLPVTITGVCWMLLRSDTYEHLSQHDTPVSTARTLSVTAIAAVLGVVGIAATLINDGEMLAWRPLHTSLWAAVTSWPFAWLDADLTVAGPSTPLEYAIWLIGPALLIVAAIYAVVRRERRELGVLIGAVATVAISTVIGFIDDVAGIRLVEYSLLVCSPIFAALAIRAVALARESAREADEGVGRLRGVGPLLLVVTFGVLSISATAVTGSRMVAAPALSTVPLRDGSALIAGGDQWLPFIVNGERVPGGFADADRLSAVRSGAAKRGITWEGYDSLILSSSPLGSDPPLRYVEQPELDPYQARLFYDAARRSVALSAEVSADAIRQRMRQQTAGRRDAEDAAEVLVPSRHTPVEDRLVRSPDRPAGLLLPPADVKGCASDDDPLRRGSCLPRRAQIGALCTNDDAKRAVSSLDRSLSRRERPVTASSNVHRIEVPNDPSLPQQPPLMGVQCFDVDVAEDSRVLNVHIRDIGVVMGAMSARAEGKWTSTKRSSQRGEIDGGGRRTSSEPGSSLTYGRGRLAGSYDLVLEGALGAGVEVSGGPLARADGAAASDAPTVSLGGREIRGSANGFSQIMRSMSLQGGATVVNSSGTDVSLGRLFARPRDIPSSCDIPLALTSGARREHVLTSIDGAGRTIVRPGLVVEVVTSTSPSGARVARVVVGSYLAHAGQPRFVLLDWTEQFEAPVRVEGCDGTIIEEQGDDRSPARSRNQLVASRDALRAFADQAGIE